MNNMTIKAMSAAFPANEPSNPGMNLRTYLAGQALAGLMANPDWSNTSDMPYMATHAVAMADTLIEALNT